MSKKSDAIDNLSPRYQEKIGPTTQSDDGALADLVDAFTSGSDIDNLSKRIFKAAIEHHFKGKIEAAVLAGQQALLDSLLAYEGAYLSRSILLAKQEPLQAQQANLNREKS